MRLKSPHITIRERTSLNLPDKLAQELLGPTVIRRPINKNETPFPVNGPLEHGGTKEEIPLSPRAHLKLLLSETQQHSPRMTIGRKPIPHELATNF
jgi:hypothetical protein